MPRQVTSIDLVEIRTRDDNPQQVREYNFIFQYSAIDTGTGALIADDEYRTIASDVQLNLDEARAKMVDLVETEQT